MKIMEGPIYDDYTYNVVYHDLDSVHRQCPVFCKDGWCTAFGTFCQGFGNIDICPLLKRRWEGREHDNKATSR